MSNKVKYAFLTLAVIVVGIYYYNKYKVAPTVDLEKLELVDRDGKPYDIQKLKGKKVIWAFYASWCRDCVKELSDLFLVHYSDLSDVEVICVTDDPMEKLISFSEKKDYNYTFVRIHNKTLKDIGVHVLPTTFLLNKDFKIVHEQVGRIHWQDPSTLNHLKKLME